MKLKLKEDPKEWRKITLLSAAALAVVSSLLRWRHHLTTTVWISLLVILAVVMLLAVARPRIFRGYYRGSSRIGFAISQFLGRVVLAIFFILILTPLALIFRMLGKDPLRLKRAPTATTYWHQAKTPGSLDKMF
jgi:hypothetical protein